MIIVPKFEPLAVRISDWPVIVWVNRTPGTSRQICSIRSIATWVRSIEAASGNCTLISK